MQRAETVQPLTQQTIGEAQYFGRWSNDDSSVPGVGRGYRALGLSAANADHLYWSYATGSLGSQLLCSATFVAPNVLLSAGHCGHYGYEPETNTDSTPRKAIFRARLYREGSEDSNVELQVTCETLVQNLGGDYMFLYCDDLSPLNGGGLPQPGNSGSFIPPGELLGMGDFDFSSVDIGDDIWTAWWNPDCPNGSGSACSGPDQLVFSPGQVTGNPGGFAWDDLLDPFQTDHRSAQGASGCAAWRIAGGSYHRVISAGQARGTQALNLDIGGPGDKGVGFSRLSSVLSFGVAAPDPLGRNTSAYFSSIGLVGNYGWSYSDYSGGLDGDANGRFDLIERLDRLNGVNQGETVWLGFESPRQNQMWIQPSAADISFHDLGPTAHLVSSGSSDEVVLTMPKVGFSGNFSAAGYRFSIMSNTHQSGSTHGLRVEVRPLSGGAPEAVVDIPTPADGKWYMHTEELPTLGAGWKQVDIRILDPAYNGWLAAMTFVKEGSYNSFDTRATRMNWRNDADGSRAWIVPYGRSSPPLESSWAGLVIDQDGATEVDWTLRNRQLAAVAPKQYEICFWVRSFPLGQVGIGRIVFGNGAPYQPPDSLQPEVGATYLDGTFDIPLDWERRCMSFTALGSDNLLKFGHLKGQPEYLIDDVRLNQQ